MKLLANLSTSNRTVSSCNFHSMLLLIPLLLSLHCVLTQRSPERPATAGAPLASTHVEVPHCTHQRHVYRKKVCAGMRRPNISRITTAHLADRSTVTTHGPSTPAASRLHGVSIQPVKRGYQGDFYTNRVGEHMQTRHEGEDKRNHPNLRDECEDKIGHPSPRTAILK